MNIEIKQIDKIELNAFAEFEFKTRSDWAKELNEYGLEGDQSIYKIPNQISPLSIALADLKFVSRCGENPRIAIEKGAKSDRIFLQIYKEMGLTGKDNLGLTFEGYDFEDYKSTKELGSFLHQFETRYRQIKQQQFN